MVTSDAARRRYRCLIVYQSEDSDFAIGLAAALERAMGEPVFIDKKLPAGLPWFVGVEAALSEASAMIGVIPAVLDERRYLQDELYAGRARESLDSAFGLMPVKHPGSGDLPLFMKSRTWASAADFKDLDALAEHLAGLIKALPKRPSEKARNLDRAGLLNFLLKRVEPREFTRLVASVGELATMEAQLPPDGTSPYPYHLRVRALIGLSPASVLDALEHVLGTAHPLCRQEIHSIFHPECEDHQT